VLPALVTDPAMRDQPAVQEERRRCAAHHCESGPAIPGHPAVHHVRVTNIETQVELE
jgi:hypothetical protein